MGNDVAYPGIDNLEVMAAAENYGRFLRDLVASAAGPPDAKPRILDFGAGTGTVAASVTSLGYVVTCLEPDPDLRDHLRSRGLSAVAAVADLADGDPFDLIYSMNVLEHIEDDVAALAGIRDLLRPGGKLALYVPAFAVLYSAMDRKVGHHRRYRRRDLRSVAERAGFVVDSARYVDCVGFVAALAYKVAGNRDGDIHEGSVAAFDRYAFPMSVQIDKVTQRMFGKNLFLLAHRA
jgi:SAM-dependent methyltransferase